MVELRMWILKFGICLSMCLKHSLGSKGFTLEPDVAKWEDAMMACDNNGNNILIPGRRFRVKALENTMSDGDKIWLHGWRSVSNITPDAENKLRTLKVDFAKPRKNPCAIVCRNDVSYFVASASAGSVTDSRTICENEGGTLLDITTEADAMGVIDVMQPDDPHWANSISSQASKIKQCLYAEMVGSVVKYKYGDCKSEFLYTCISGKDFSPLISFKKARFDEFETVINEYTASLTSSSSSTVLEPSSTSMPMPSSSISMSSETSSVPTSPSVTSSMVVSSDPALTTGTTSSTSDLAHSTSSSILISPTTTTDAYSTMTSKTASSESQTTSNLFAGVLKQNESATLSDIMSPFSSTISSVSSPTSGLKSESSSEMSTSSISSSEMSTSSISMPTSDNAMLSDTLSTSVAPSFVLTTPVNTYKSSELESTTFYLTDSIADTEKEMKSTNTLQLTSTVIQTSLQFKQYSIHVLSNSSGIPAIIEYDDDDSSDGVPSVYSSVSSIIPTTSFYTPTSSAEFQATETVTDENVPYHTDLQTVENNIYSSNVDPYSEASSSVLTSASSLSTNPSAATLEATPFLSSSVSSSILQVTAAEATVSSTSEYNFDLYDILTPYMTESVNVEPLTEISEIITSSSSMSVEILPTSSSIHISPTSSSEVSEAMYMTSDIIDSGDISATTTEAYIYDVYTPYEETPGVFDIYPTVDQPFYTESVTTERTDDIDVGIEDHLEVEVYDDGNTSAGKSEEVPQSEEGIEVGVWIAFGILIALVIVSLVLALFLYKRRQKQKTKFITPTNGVANAGAGETIELRDSRSPSRENGKANEAPGV